MHWLVHTAPDARPELAPEAWSRPGATALKPATKVQLRRQP